MTAPTVAIIGAGPVGLEAALAAAERGIDFRLYEASDDVAASVRAWAHVQLFTPWRLNVSARARAALAREGVEPPDGEACPTGGELVDRVLRPLSRLPMVGERLRLGTRVIAISRDRLLKSDEIGTGGRAGVPFRLLLRDANGSESVAYADVVVDCTGTWEHPNTLGAGGIPAPGERAAAPYIVRAMPDLSASADGPVDPGSAAWGGRRILLVGAGHSAQTTARDLAAFLDRYPATRVTWVIRSPAPTFGEVENDTLPARRALVTRAKELALALDTPFDVRLGRTVDALSATGRGVVVTLRREDGSTDEVVVDRIISLTGSVGDAGLYRQLQVHECYATSGPMKLAANLLASSGGDCMTQQSHGVEALKSPEPDFYILGSKSYGRNTSFLMRIGWEQVEEVFSSIDAVARTAAGTT